MSKRLLNELFQIKVIAIHFAKPFVWVYSLKVENAERSAACNPEELRKRI